MIDILQFRHSPSIDRVWARIRDFNEIRTWHPAFRESSIEEGRSEPYPISHGKRAKLRQRYREGQRFS
jgi:hypothetical protein